MPAHTPSPPPTDSPYYHDYTTASHALHPATSDPGPASHTRFSQTAASPDLFVLPPIPRVGQQLSTTRSPTPTYQHSIYSPPPYTSYGGPTSYSGATAGLDNLPSYSQRAPSFSHPTLASLDTSLGGFMPSPPMPASAYLDRRSDVMGHGRTSTGGLASIEHYDSPGTVDHYALPSLVEAVGPSRLSRTRHQVQPYTVPPRSSRRVPQQSPAHIHPSLPPLPSHAAIIPPNSSLLPKARGKKAPINPLEKNFACTKCPARFARNHDLTRHYKVHDPVKQYRCKGCEKLFTRRDALKRHTSTKSCGQEEFEQEEKPKRGRKKNPANQNPPALATASTSPTTHPTTRSIAAQLPPSLHPPSHSERHDSYADYPSRSSPLGYDPSPMMPPIATLTASSSGSSSRSTGQSSRPSHEYHPYANASGRTSRR